MSKLRKIGSWFNTPRTLQVALVVIAVATLAFFLTLSSGYRENRQAAEVIGKSTTTGIIAAQTLKVELSGMHAIAGQQLLSGGNQGQLAGEYNEKRKQVSASLVTASQAITFGAAERVPIQRLQYLLPTYQSLVTEALEARARGDAAGAARLYLSADNLVEEHLLPAADQLDEANSAAMTLNYDKQVELDGSTDTRMLLSVAVLLALLVAAQLYMMRRFRRLVNPAVAIATILVAGSGIYIHGTFSTVHESLREGKEESFEKLHTLYRTEAQVYVVRSSMQNQLIAGLAGDTTTGEHRSGLDRLARLDNGLSFATFAQQVASGRIADEPTGYLPRLVRRNMFDGEREALAEAAKGLDYFNASRERAVNSLKSGRADEATTIVLNDPGFPQLLRALNQAKSINRAQFDSRTQTAFRALAGSDLIAPIVTCLIFALAFFGMRQRWSEYNV